MQAITSLLASLFPHTVTVVPPGATNGIGEVTPGTSFSVRAQVSGKTQKVKIEGKVIKSTVQMIACGVFGLTTSHSFTLPSGFGPIHPKPQGVHVETDDNGAHHEIVYF